MPLLCLLNLISASDADAASYTLANLCKRYDTSDFSFSLIKTFFSSLKRILFSQKISAHGGSHRLTGEAMKPEVNNSINSIFLGTSHTPMVYFWAHIKSPNEIFWGKSDSPILHRWVGISIIRRKGWKAQICGKGKTPKWALGGSRVTRPWPPYQTLMAK